MPEREPLKQRIHKEDIMVGVSVPMHVERPRLEHLKYIDLGVTVLMEQPRA